MASLRIAALAVALLLALPALALAEGDGTITGRLENLTAGGPLPAGDEVTLRVFQGQESLREDTTLSDADGAFAFTGLETGPEWAYRLLARHGGGTFAGEALAFGDEGALQAIVAVYDTTAVDPGLRTVQHSVVLTPGGDRSMGALHVVTMDLPGDRAYVVGPESGALIEFAMPDEFFRYRALSGFEAAELTDIEMGFGAAMTLVPGPNPFTFSYQFAWDSSGTEFVLGTRPPGGELMLLARAGELTVEGSGVSSDEPVLFEDMALDAWRVDSTAAEGRATVWLQDAGSVGLLAAIGRMGPAVWGGIGVGLFVVLLIVTGWRGGRLTTMPRRFREAEVDRLLAVMAECDRRAASAGGRGRALARRAAAKDALLDLLRDDDALVRYLERHRVESAEPASR